MKEGDLKYMVKSIFAQEVIINDKIAFFNSIIRKPVFMSIENYNKYMIGQFNELEYEKLIENKYFLEIEEEKELIISAKKYFNYHKNEIDVVYINITNQCNLNCDYCFVKEYKSNNYLDINKFLVFFEKIKKYIDSNKKHIQFILYGGEPVINQEIFIAVLEKLASLKNSSIGIITNATLLNEKIIKLLAKYRVYVNISLDGPKSITDSHRKFNNIDGSVYEKSIAVIEQLKNKINQSQLALSITITQEILDKQEEVLKWLEILGIKHCIYNILKKTNNSIEYYEKLMKFMQKSYEEYNIIEGKIIKFLNDFSRSGINLTSCAALGGNEITLDTDGRVYSCHGCLKKQFYLGRVEEDFLNKEKYLMYETIPIYTKKCFKCKAFGICGGKCYFEKEDYLYCSYMIKMTEWVARKNWSNS